MLLIITIIIMSKSKEAKELFENGYNCSQSMLFTYGRNYFKENALALKLASGFGAGISYRGEMCGTVSGALMILGLHYGYSDVTMDLAKEMTFRITKEFLETFEKKNGSVICNRLLKAEINTPEGLEHARENGLFKSICPALIESSSDILDSLFLKYPADKIQNSLF
jgi:C_GCAxxG_C_C family probable redox protein